MKKTKCLIIGSGPAGCSAAVYAARANLSPIMVHGMQPGGQLTITTDVENYIGFSSISGPELMSKMIEHAQKYGTEVVQDMIQEIDFSSRPFKVKGELYLYEADTIIIATGASAKWLGLDSEKKYQGYGVSGCATCDGFFFKNKIVAVVGGGNTALTEALHLTHHASKVYLIHRRSEFRGEKVLIDKVLQSEKIEIIWNSVINEIVGEEDKLGKFVTGVVLNNTLNGSTKNLNLDGVFIAIGHKPNTDIFKEKLEMDDEGYIVVRPGTTITSIPGVFASGDVQDKIYRQAITSAGTGCMAALDAERFLNH